MLVVHKSSVEGFHFRGFWMRWWKWKVFVLRTNAVTFLMSLTRKKDLDLDEVGVCDWSYSVLCSMQVEMNWHHCFLTWMQTYLPYHCCVTFFSFLLYEKVRSNSKFWTCFLACKKSTKHASKIKTFLRGWKFITHRWVGKLKKLIRIIALLKI